LLVKRGRQLPELSRLALDASPVRRRLPRLATVPARESTPRGASVWSVPGFDLEPNRDCNSRRASGKEPPLRRTSSDTAPRSGRRLPSDEPPPERTHGGCYVGVGRVLVRRKIKDKVRAPWLRDGGRRRQGNDDQDWLQSHVPLRASMEHMLDTWGLNLWRPRAPWCPSSF